jgi:ketosteroid isomerase-like protein
MHPHAALLQTLFGALARHDAQAIADCYHPDAIFHDIAFDLRGRTEIHAMWRMVCAGDIRATFDIMSADDEAGHVRVVDEYTFTETGRRVRNVIESRFRFADHLVIEHRDQCDPRVWADMAIGGVGGFLAGRVEVLRRWKARRKLRRFAASA